MVKKKSPLEPTARRKRAYELDGMSTLQAPQDPLRQIEDQSLRDLSNEYRQLRVEEMIAKKRKQLDSSSPTSNIQTQKENLELLKTMMELQKMSQPKESPDKTLEYLNFFNTLMKQYQGSNAQPSFFDEYIKARELGIVGHSEPGEPNSFSVEMEKLRGERMLDSKRIDLELKKMSLKAEDGRNKIGMVASILSPVAAYTSGKMAEDMRKRGMDTANKFIHPGNPSPEAAILSSLQGETAEMQITCDCGFNKSMLVPVPPPSNLACPGCGKILTTGPPPSSNEEAEDEWRNEK